MHSLFLLKKLLILSTVVIALTAPLRAISATTPSVQAGITAPTSAPAAALITRILPAHADQFILELTPGDIDSFEIEPSGDKILLRGNSPLSLTSAFNYYLQNLAHLEYSNYGSNIAISPNAKLPLPPGPIKRKATLPFRMTYNYCTFGYTMAWWDWSRWERELDYLALNGINHPFIITGQEAVWINTFKQYGCTDEEIRHWLGSPAHFPWMFMQNMEDFGGTLPTAFVEKRVELAQKILQRCRELGMKPILQGYYGMLPSAFAKHNSQAKILPQGEWCGFRRPDMLDPTDPIFEKIARTFLVEQEKLFGRSGYYAADPFHEGGNSKGVDMADCGERIFNAMKAVDPDAVWIKQCWQSTNEKMLSRIPADRVIALDLNSESRPYWQNGAFAGKRWTWNLLQNFGGNTDLGGNIALLSHLFTDALHSPQKGNLYGMGLLPEGWHSTPAIYSLQMEFVWRSQPFQPNEWLKYYTHRRYGKRSEDTSAAWDNLGKSVYGISYRNAQTPANAIFMARPLRGNPPKAREWGTTRQQHDPLVLIAAWDNFLAASEKNDPATDGFAFDLADVTRQALADSTTKLYSLIDQAYKNKDQAALEKYTGAFLDILGDIDATLTTRQEFLLGPWLTDARAWGTNDTEKAFFEKQARTLITLWDGKPGSVLNDYACRQWQGLVKDYYAPRWVIYFDALQKSLADGTALDANACRKKISELELGWINADNRYPTTASGDIRKIAPSLRTKYTKLFDEIYADQKPYEGPADPIGYWKYQANGQTYVRQFNQDSTITIYQNGKATPWMKDFIWTLSGDKIVAERGGTGGEQIIHTFRTKDKIEFTTEGYGEASRVEKP